MFWMKDLFLHHVNLPYEAISITVSFLSQCTLNFLELFILYQCRSLNNNSFSGRIPTSIGRLSNLYWLDLAENQLDGPIPVSDGNTPGLDMLVKAKHFHLEKRKFSGEIPSKHFSSNMVLKHLLLSNNVLTGNIPETLGSVTPLEVIRFIRNSLSGPVPSNLNNLVNVGKLYLSNNKLSGPIPNLTGMNTLQYVDMSNNSFDESDFPPWISSLKYLTTISLRVIGF
uniref:Uncharacterized protein n=1 Tax=Quercus lobata TaxID=97700 RepID=A0A7N2L3E4_QUELO